MVFAKIFSNLYVLKMNKIGVKKIISEFHLDLTQHDIKSFLGKQFMTSSGVYFQCLDTRIGLMVFKN